MDWKDWNGKRIFVQLKSGSIYSGKIQEVTDADEQGVIFIFLIDKFGDKVIFSVSEILKIKEEQHGSN